MERGMSEARVVMGNATPHTGHCVDAPFGAAVN